MLISSNIDFPFVHAIAGNYCWSMSEMSMTCGLIVFDIVESADMISDRIRVFA